MNVGSASSQSPIAELTRLAVAARTAKHAEQQATSPAVQALQLENVKAIAAGKIDTYA
ncbi:hypothetical protein HC028_04135 [Planosporangium flavigriseum]|nr:hypothetical protein [Planosporangium flavigriseum]NJC63701.1 hypothetical protein [Planosporangium flavigriseum]